MPQLTEPSAKLPLSSRTARSFAKRGRICSAIAAGASLFLIAGCGGSGSSGTSATNSAGLRSVTVSLAWPTSRATSTGSRSLPESANSIVVTVIDSGGFTDSRMVNRPATGSTQSSTTVSFFGLAAGTIQISALAYTGTGGAGVVVDPDSTSATVGAGSSGNATITFASIPISAVQFTPSAPQTILQGGSYTLTAAGLDANGNLVTTSPTGKWTSSNPAVATVGQTTGLVTGTGPGTATITFTDSTYSATGSTSVVVQGGNSTVSIN